MLAHLQAVIETNRGKIVVCRHLPMMLMKLLGINIAFLLSLFIYCSLRLRIITEPILFFLFFRVLLFRM